MKVIKMALLIISLGIFSLIGASFAPSEVLASGMLYEPYFFLIPVGMLFIFVGILGLVFGFIAYKMKQKKNYSR